MYTDQGWESDVSVLVSKCYCSRVVYLVAFTIPTFWGVLCSLVFIVSFLLKNFTVNFKFAC